MHTKLPWKLGQFNKLNIWSESEPKLISEGFAYTAPASTEVEALANAQFIVTACNTHHDLLEALKDVVDYHSTDYQEYDWQPRALAAIQKATGGT